MARYVYDFAEGGRDRAGLLGGKGAGLAEMARLGLPVPAGFTVSTEACRVHAATGAPPPELDGEVEEHLARLERAAGRRLGQVDDPLLLAVRPGAEPPVPGPPETVLDVGLNDHAVLGLAGAPARERFAWDSYRRLVERFGTVVMGVEPELFERVRHRVGEQHHVADERLDACDLIRVVETYKDLVAERTGEEFPQDPAEQLRRAVRAVLVSWNSGPARARRRRAGVPEGLATAVTVQTMVSGNRGAGSGSGVALTRDPATGGPGASGVYLPDAQGEDVAAGVRDPLPLEELGRLAPAAYAELGAHLRRLDGHYGDVCAVEFTVERGRLWLLGVRPGARAVPGAL
ncbi:PEP/pyruvate-binding domain-containing protein [Streptomyces somaliensis]|uniref:Pyruvate, phosphate dikinase n=1 Tax=Streptomyces somaliensis (strain ATCC 33201 / DSM 40738 / JCM 12659 / KCTC 9044 / NCTC 11332 / NRRL B-12077 / IP 733) TaxID=1134445 RepID=A0AA44IDU6_STRE0|nr:PEP/pyruvate-binding domain-containing protein [Streptomyces somaliensis]NKY14648.1 pyruvate, phosphate dikinase [Streptomyces somaliensis DSM 40738]